MEKLSSQFLDSCRKDTGLIFRGENMTRIETFVDAAFAFAVTMLVISIDQMPRSPEELIELAKDIPSFVFSALVIGAVWVSHSNWSKIFGLQDGVTVLLSLLLVILVLIFVYPIKLIMQTAVESVATTRFDLDFLVTGLFEVPGWGNGEASVIFKFFSVGLIALSLIYIGFYQNTLRFREELSLTEKEYEYCIIANLVWCMVAATALLSFIIASLISPDDLRFGVYVYFLLLIPNSLLRKLYSRFRST